MNIFSITGSDFFKALTGKYQNIFIDCLEIIYNSYRTELSYGIDKEVLVLQLTDYFDRNSSADIQFEDGAEVFKDSRAKANEFLRKLRAYGWIEYEFGNDQRAKIVMPNHSVTIMQALMAIIDVKEMEYQSEVSAIYSLLINENLYDRPYPQIIKPVYDRTIALFTELKKLNTGIRKYIDELTEGKTPEELMEHFFSYNENIGSKAYHRMKTNDNVSRFRNTIVSRLRDILSDEAIMERAVIGYQNIEGENDKTEASDKVIEIITNVIGYFDSYDDIEKEIEHKHSKYLRSAVNRAKLAFLNTNNIEGKISTILRCLANAFETEEEYGIYDDVPDDYCRIFNMFPQSFLGGESLKTIGISKRSVDVEEIFTPHTISEEEILQRRIALKEKNEQRFSRKNINAFVCILLKDREKINASEIEVHTKRDMIRLIFISIYGRDKRSEYIVLPKENIICNNGFKFKDFTLKRRAKQHES
ncbi:MAG: hypothetical protein K2K91_02525 [Ruminococcus sp.]|nr:hypothetical protein [Ruminococcus sp.]